MIGINAKKLVLIILLLLFFFSIISVPVFSQGKEPDKGMPTLDAEMKTKVVQKVVQLMIDNYIFKETAEKMAEKLNTKLSEGQYDKIDDVFRFSQALTQDLRSVSKDGHIRVTYNPERIKGIRASRSKSDEERERERKATLERQDSKISGFEGWRYGREISAILI